MLQRFLNWFAARSPRAQFLYGILLSATAAALLLYCLGMASFVARPFLLTNPDTSDLVPFTTPTDSRVVKPVSPTLTFPPITAPLPQTTLRATPTQAPLPTRAPPTETPTPTATNPNAPFETITDAIIPSAPTLTATRTRAATATFTPVARP